jgi:serine/threonine-protein kinase
MAPEVSVPILCQACDALQAAHAADVVHRDLKPENIFLVKRGGTDHFVKLVDFGIAKLGVTRSGGLTAAGLVVGTPEYMAPEQWMGEDIDGRADLYALGIIAYLLATGRLPFREATPLAYFSAHKDKQPEPPRKINPSLPAAYEAVILKALAKRPEDRFQVAFEMREALRQAIGLPSPTPRQPTPGPSTPPSARAPSQPTTPVTSLPAKVSAPGFPERTLTATGISRAGLFFQAEPPLPALFARVKLALMHPQRTLELTGEVVREVDATQAQAWNLPGSGFAVQFVALTPDLRSSLARLVDGRPLETPPPLPDDDKGESLLAAWEKRLACDCYALLAVDLDAECSEVRRRARKVTTELDAVGERPLSQSQRRRLAAVRERAEVASTQLGTPARRAEHDATIGNFRGVARCLAAGLNLRDLGQLRSQFISTRPRSETAAMLKSVSANAHVKVGLEQAALDEYEAALGLDPLNEELHRLYWTLKHRVARGREVAR